MDKIRVENYLQANKKWLLTVSHRAIFVISLSYIVNFNIIFQVAMYVWFDHKPRLDRNIE
jgi:hypothetical protein